MLAIIGVLSAIAIPSFLRYQLRSRTAESLLNLKSIATAEEIYMAEFGTYVSVSPAVPTTSPGNGRTQWTSGSSFDVLGWGPEGTVQFQYRAGMVIWLIGLACCYFARMRRSGSDRFSAVSASLLAAGALFLLYCATVEHVGARFYQLIDDIF